MTNIIFYEKKEQNAPDLRRLMMKSAPVFLPAPDVGWSYSAQKQNMNPVLDGLPSLITSQILLALKMTTNSYGHERNITAPVVVAIKGMCLKMVHAIQQGFVIAIMVLP